MEYWRGNEAAKKWIENDSPLFTSTITLAEVVRFFVSGGQDEATIRTCLDDIRARSSILPVDEDIAVAAGHLKKREVAGIADSIILATARNGDHKVVTGDPHFKEITDAIYLGP
ncbi:MAG: PIN domain-containing protein [Methanoregula sp.]|nr:MAG: PIN domain-containing protein [Methanoregula sp.]